MPRFLALAPVCILIAFMGSLVAACTMYSKAWAFTWQFHNSVTGKRTPPPGIPTEKIWVHEAPTMLQACFSFVKCRMMYSRLAAGLPFTRTSGALFSNSLGWVRPTLFSQSCQCASPLTFWHVPPTIRTRTGHLQALSAGSATNTSYLLSTPWELGSSLTCVVTALVECMASLGLTTRPTAACSHTPTQSQLHDTSLHANKLFRATVLSVRTYIFESSAL